MTMGVIMANTSTNTSITMKTNCAVKITGVTAALVMLLSGCVVEGPSLPGLDATVVVPATPMAAPAEQRDQEEEDHHHHHDNGRHEGERKHHHDDDEED